MCVCALAPFASPASGVLLFIPAVARWFPAEKLSPVLRRVLLYAVLFCFAFSVQSVFSKYRHKTGYHWRAVGF